MCGTRLMREGRDQDHLTAGENAAVVGVALNEIRITFSTIHFYVFQQRLYVTFMSCKLQHFLACLSLDNFADYVYGFVPAATAVFFEAYARLMSALALSAASSGCKSVTGAQPSVQWIPVPSGDHPGDACRCQEEHHQHRQLSPGTHVGPRYDFLHQPKHHDMEQVHLIAM